MAVLIKDVTKNFGNPPKAVLKNFNLTLETGITNIMGVSGSGKTTLINILSGFLNPDSGSITGNSGLKLSCVFQEDRLLENETAFKNVLFVVKRTEKNKLKAIELLKAAGLGDSTNKKCKELSGGMKRRTAICRSLIVDFDMLILDEAFKGLDDELKKVLMDLVTEYTKNKIVLNITHSKEEAEYLGGKVVFIHT